MKKRLLSLALCVVMLFCVLSLTACGNNYESMVEDYFTALYTGEAEDALKAVNIEAFMDILIDEGEYDEDDAEEFLDAYLETLEDRSDRYCEVAEDEYGDDYDFDVEIMRSKEMKNSELKDYEDMFEEVWDVEVDVEEGYTVKYKLIFGNDSEKGEIEVIKVNGDWVIVGA